MSVLSKLLVATGNPGKLKEFAGMLEDVPFELVSLEDLGIHEKVAETGSTFVENAALKATSYAEISGMLTLADDSGLEVKALGGEPGVQSARYGGDGGSDRSCCSRTWRAYPRKSARHDSAAS